jgi:hypothetical protein
MKIILNQNYVKGEFDTKTMELVSIRGRKRVFGRDEIDASLCIKDGMNLAIAEIGMGDMESSNILCDEIVRRFNEFPEEQKR